MSAMSILMLLTMLMLMLTAVGLAFVNKAENEGTEEPLVRRRNGNDTWQRMKNERVMLYMTKNEGGSDAPVAFFYLFFFSFASSLFFVLWVYLFIYLLRIFLLSYFIYILTQRSTVNYGFPVLLTIESLLVDGEKCECGIHNTWIQIYR